MRTLESADTTVTDADSRVRDLTGRGFQPPVRGFGARGRNTRRRNTKRQNTLRMIFSAQPEYGGYTNPGSGRSVFFSTDLR